MRARIILVGLLAACGPSDRDQSAASDKPPEAMSEMGGMRGMQGMAGMSDSTMTAVMRQHMKSMQSMQSRTPDSLQIVLPEHRQKAANLIAEMNRQMRDMGMAPTAGWNELVDSLRQDLTRMPEIAGPDVQKMMPAHLARMNRLMDLHQGMMPAVTTR